MIQIGRIFENYGCLTFYSKRLNKKLNHQVLSCNQMKVSVFRKEHFNAAHKLENPKWSPDKNREVFGKCNNGNYHGHNYELIAEVTGDIDPETGYVVDMKYLSNLIQTQVTERFDHKNLNLDVEEFKNLIPSAENIAVVIWQILRKQLDEKLDLSVTLYETERNFVRYPASK